MTHILATNYAKNYCNRTPIVQVIVENVVTCFFWGHSVLHPTLSVPSNHTSKFFSLKPAIEIYKILLNCRNKQSDSDPIPTSLLTELLLFLFIPGHDYQHRQSASHLMSVLSSKNLLSPTSQENYCRQRSTFKLPSNLQPLSYVQNNRTCCQMST